MMDWRTIKLEKEEKGAAEDQEQWSNYLFPIGKEELDFERVKEELSTELQVSSGSGDNDKESLEGNSRTLPLTCTSALLTTSSRQCAKNDLSCSSCGGKFATKWYLMKHIEQYVREKVFTCALCEMGFYFKIFLKNHVLGHIQDKRFLITSHCGRKTTRNRHTLQDGKKPTAMCTYCGKGFGERWRLKEHIRIHTGEKPYQCNYCEKKFTQIGNRNCHIRVHTGDKPFACTHCGKTFTISNNLTRHSLIHTGKKPFLCSHCNKTFREKRNLKRHIMKHTGEKPFTCTQCGKKFSLASNLKQHSVIHTGIKAFQCNHCGKKFSKSASLKNHCRMHTGEKPYTCTLCHKKFDSSSSHQRHIRFHLMPVKIHLQRALLVPSSRQTEMSIRPSGSGFSIPS